MEFEFNLAKARLTIATFIFSSLILLILILTLNDVVWGTYSRTPVLVLVPCISYGIYVSLLIYRLIHCSSGNTKITIYDNLLKIPSYYLGRKHIPLCKIFSLESRLVNKSELLIIGVNGQQGIFLDSDRFKSSEEFYLLKSELKKIIDKNISDKSVDLNVYKNSRVWLEQKSNSFLTWMFVLVCILFFGIGYVSYIYRLSHDEFLYLGIGKKTDLDFGDWYRIFSSSFIHANIFHLLINLFLLGMLGELLEHVICRVRFLIVILLSSVVGYFFFLIFSMHEFGAGISGGVFGLFGAFVAMRIRYEERLPGSLRMVPLPRILLLFVLEFLLEFFVLENVDYSVHLGGFLAGFLYLFLSTKDKKLDDIGKTGLIEKYLAGVLGFAYLAGLAFFMFLVFKGEVANMPDFS